MKLACERPTRNYPGGRTGTWAGVQAHQNAGEPVCAQCSAAAKAHMSRMRTPEQRHAEYQRNRDCHLERNYRQKHGFGLDLYEEMLAAQGGKCAICGTGEPGGKSGERFHLDHDHTCCPKNKTCSKCRRSLLCANCNVGLGVFGDDPDRLIAAAAYLLSRRDVLKEVLNA